MNSINDRTQTRKVVVIAALIFAMAASSVRGCSLCESDGRAKEQIETLGAPLKRDIFMSRGWAAGGGPAFTSRSDSDLRKRPRIIEMLINDEDPEMVPEPRTEYLRARPATYPAKTSAAHRQMYLPQLFISSGWGPLGK